MLRGGLVPAPAAAAGVALAVLVSVLVSVLHNNPFCILLCSVEVSSLLKI